MQIKASVFISPEDGSKDLFVHHLEIQAGGEYATLNDGQKVEFEVGQGQPGMAAMSIHLKKDYHPMTAAFAYNTY